MEELVAKGSVKAIGISNFTITKTENLLKTAKILPAVNQGKILCKTICFFIMILHHCLDWQQVAAQKKLQVDNKIYREQDI